MERPLAAIYPEHLGHPNNAQAGEVFYFEYHCFESNTSQDAELWHHTKQMCTIIRRLTEEEVDEEEVGIMYRVRFNDDYEHDVFTDELYLKEPSEK